MDPREIDMFRQRWIINSPIVYRYMENQYIERFFKYGELRLTSYQKFRNENLDEIRGDNQEGTHEYIIWNKTKEYSITLQRKTGDHNFIFCTSSLHNPNLMNKDNFDCDGCFKINNTLGFGFEIARKIKEFTYGLEGPAKYTPTGQTPINIENYGLEDFDKDALQDENKRKLLLKTFHEISQRDTSLFFSKRDKYQFQNEYRFIWSHNQPQILDHLFINTSS